MIDFWDKNRLDAHYKMWEMIHIKTSHKGSDKEKQEMLG